MSEIETDTLHRQVRLQVGEFEADVDEELAPLLEQLAKAGINTLMSCQENRPGIAWITFSRVNDLGRFLEIVGAYEPDGTSLYRRITGDAEEGGWEYELYPMDAGMHYEESKDGVTEEGPGGPPCFCFQASVRFPRTDLPILLERMTQYNAWLDAV